MPERTVAQRVHKTVAGLVAGDAATWTSWWHRMSQLPPRRAVRLGEAWDHARAGVTTSLPTPYLHASSPALIDPAGPTDDTEWFVVAARHLLGQRLDGAPATEPYAVWRELADARAEDEGSVRGRVGTVIALSNLQDGTTPPASGHDNPHYFDDMACVRAVAAGSMRSGSPAAAADLAEGDAVVTHGLDGVWGARAVAALISCLIVGDDIERAVDAAIAELPSGSWIAHVVAECLGVAGECASAMELAASLERDVVDHVYAYSTQAPETVGLLLAHLSVATDHDALLLGGFAHPRHADGLVPLAGAVAGAAFGGSRGELTDLRGVCVRGLVGVRLAPVVDALVGAGEREIAR